jgi:hypothetical protein
MMKAMEEKKSKGTVKNFFSKLFLGGRKNYFLTADLGGTWSRLAIIADGKIVFKSVIETKHFTGAELKLFASDFSSKYKKNISAAAIACAGEVERKNGNEKCKLTRADVFLDGKKLEKALGVPVFILNDLEAEAYFAKLYGNDALLIAAGTGLGVSVITDRGEVIATEDGHMLVDEVIASIKQLSKTKKKIEYEDILAGKDNVLLLAMFGENKTRKIKLGHDDFSRIYSFVLEDFIFKMISVHKKNEIKKIFLAGGIVLGNKLFFEKFGKTLGKKMAVDVKIIEDEFAVMKGAAIYAENRKAYE